MEKFKIKHHREFASTEVIRIDSKFYSLSTKDKTRVLNSLEEWVRLERTKITK